MMNNDEDDDRTPTEGVFSRCHRTEFFWIGESTMTTTKATCRMLTGPRSSTDVVVVVVIVDSGVKDVSGRKRHGIKTSEEVLYGFWKIVKTTIQNSRWMDWRAGGKEEVKAGGEWMNTERIAIGAVSDI